MNCCRSSEQSAIYYFPMRWACENGRKRGNREGGRSKGDEGNERREGHPERARERGTEESQKVRMRTGCQEGVTSHPRLSVSRSQSGKGLGWGKCLWKSKEKEAD